MLFMMVVSGFQMVSSPEKFLNYNYIKDTLLPTEFLILCLKALKWDLCINF